MDHIFRSRRLDLVRVTKGIALANDLRILATLCPSDHALIIARREPLIEDAAVRDVVMRHATRLGLLLEDLDVLCETTQLAKTHGSAWTSYLHSSSPPPAVLWEDVDAASCVLRVVRDELQPLEADDASSSYSDYSDSRTVSSDDEGHDSSDEGGSESTVEEAGANKTKRPPP